MAKRLMMIGTCPALLGHSRVHDAAGRHSHSGIVAYYVHCLVKKKVLSPHLLEFFY